MIDENDLFLKGYQVRETGRVNTPRAVGYAGIGVGMKYKMCKGRMEAEVRNRGSRIRLNFQYYLSYFCSAKRKDKTRI